jgi:drug/metabolite transporter (DMT)-like permease
MLPSYVFVVYALSVSPMALVAALRESSVVFAAILGLIFLREPFGVRRIFASAVLATGIALLVLAPHSY